jgi:chromate reductase, NAD(P)H dehydrogenase (quinone)
MKLRLLAFAASLRQGSLNRRLIAAATEIARGAGASVDLAEFREFDMPLYNADVQATEGMPAGALEFRRRLEPADGVMIASPEYNFSLPGTLKNAIDWLSRMRPVPLQGKTALLLATSTGQVGGIRGLWQLRIPLEGLGVFVHPGMFSLGQGDRVLDEAGSLNDPAALGRLQTIVQGYLATARILAGREA